MAKPYPKWEDVVGPAWAPRFREAVSLARSKRRKTHHLDLNTANKEEEEAEDILTSLLDQFAKHRGRRFRQVMEVVAHPRILPFVEDALDHYVRGKSGLYFVERFLGRAGPTLLADYLRDIYRVDCDKYEHIGVLSNGRSLRRFARIVFGLIPIPKELRHPTARKERARRRLAEAGQKLRSMMDHNEHLSTMKFYADGAFVEVLNEFCQCVARFEAACVEYTNRRHDARRKVVNRA